MSDASRLAELAVLTELERWCAEQANAEADIASQPSLSAADAQLIRARAEGFRAVQRHVAVLAEQTKGKP